MAEKSPDPLDVEVGQRVRAFRLQKNLSQQKFAEQLGVTFQQIQKYESGADHIGVGRLQVIAAIFGIPTYDFFTLAGRQAAPPSGCPKTGLSER